MNSSSVADEASFTVLSSDSSSTKVVSVGSWSFPDLHPVPMMDLQSLLGLPPLILEYQCCSFVALASVHGVFQHVHSSFSDAYLDFSVVLFAARPPNLFLDAIL